MKRFKTIPNMCEVIQYNILGLPMSPNYYDVSVRYTFTNIFRTDCRSVIKTSMCDHIEIQHFTWNVWSLFGTGPSPRLTRTGGVRSMTNPVVSFCMVFSAALVVLRLTFTWSLCFR